MSHSANVGYPAIASIIEQHLKETIKADMRKRIMTIVQPEIDSMIEEITKDIVTRVSTINNMTADGITVQVAVNGVRKDAS